MYRIGCDVGGTNTDAAILDVTQVNEDERGVLATCKTPTTSIVTDGIKTAIENVLVHSAVDREKVLNVVIGTTHFVNAVVEHDTNHLQKVAVVRLCGPYTRCNRPFLDWPYALRDIIEGPTFYLDGGLEIDGREITPLDHEQVRNTAKAIFEAGVRAVAIVGVFSALDHQGRHEETCKRLMLENCSDLSITCSHTIGGPGLLVRENATILNAAILSFARRTIKDFQKAIARLDLRCPLFLTQNDGTLIEASKASLVPVKTFASGPTNSVMGAAFLRSLDNSKMLTNHQLLVVDVGGTTTDVCALLPSGFPRKAANTILIGGVRTAFSMPDVQSTSLGGGSRIRMQDNGHVTVGPDSVGYRLTSDAKIFGGQSLTTSDVVVAAGKANIGDSVLVDDLSPHLVNAARLAIKRMVENAIDKMKVSPEPAIVLLVGGGSIIVDGNLEGVVDCLRPPHHDSANAVGAAIAKVAGEIDIVEILAGQDEEEVLERFKKLAIDTAVANGAAREGTRVVEISKLPLQYVTNKATRFIIKAVGSLRPTFNITTDGERTITDHVMNSEKHILNTSRNANTNAHRIGNMANPSLGVDMEAYRPDIRDQIWNISPIDVEMIASGCGILGTGGGGSPYDKALYILDCIQNGGEVRVIPMHSLEDSDLCVFGAGYGAPSVSDERMDSGESIFYAVEQLNNLLGTKDFGAVVTVEIGGGNGLVPFATSAHFNKPVVDCDLMGRAYPTAEHCTPYLFGESITPTAIADCKGNVSVVVNAESNTKVESLLRNLCIELGNSAAVADKPLSGEAIKKYAIPNTISQAWYLGRAVHIAKQKRTDIIQTIGDIMNVNLLYTGKIIDVFRDVSQGYTVGKCTIGPLTTEEQDSISITTLTKESRNMIIPFQNEYLAAYFMDSESKTPDKDVVCTVPDLISILGQDGQALGSPDLRYGLQVSVIGMPAHPLWTHTPEGLKVGGPEFFRLGMQWKSIGEYKKPRSIFDEFDRIR